VIAVSEDIGDFLVERVGIPRTKLAVIPNGVDTKRFAPSLVRVSDGTIAPAGAPVVGTVGRLDPAKDHITLLRAFRAVRAAIPSAHLVIVGDGACRGALEAFIGEHGLAGSVHLLGERSDIPALLAQLDVFVLSSVNEGLPLALLEAMACAIPVVTTDVGTAGVVVRSANAGVVVPPKDVDGIARAIVSVLDDASLARRLGTAGRAMVADRHDIAATVDAYLDLCGAGEM
jgi:glycosyltransferase involved in cell wall biosynthesis